IALGERRARGRAHAPAHERALLPDTLDALSARGMKPIMSVHREACGQEGDSINGEDDEQAPERHGAMGRRGPSQTSCPAGKRTRYGKASAITSAKTSAPPRPTGP